MKKLLLGIFLWGIGGIYCSTKEHRPRFYAEKGGAACTLNVCGSEYFSQKLLKFPCCIDTYVCVICLNGIERSFIENTKNHEQGYWGGRNVCKKDVLERLKIPKKYAPCIVLRHVIKCPFCREYVFTQPLKKVPNIKKHCLKQVIYKKS